MLNSLTRSPLRLSILFPKSRRTLEQPGNFSLESPALACNYLWQAVTNREVMPPMVPTFSPTTMIDLSPSPRGAKICRVLTLSKTLRKSPNTGQLWCHGLLSNQPRTATEIIVWERLNVLEKNLSRQKSLQAERSFGILLLLFRKELKLFCNEIRSAKTDLH